MLHVCFYVVYVEIFSTDNFMNRPPQVTQSHNTLINVL